MKSLKPNYGKLNIHQKINAKSSIDQSSLDYFGIDNRVNYVKNIKTTFFFASYGSPSK